MLSSSYTRCLQTIEPLAWRGKLELGETDRLAEGAGLSSLLGLFEELNGRCAVLCTHRDIVWELLDHPQETGGLRGRSPAYQKS